MIGIKNAITATIIIPISNLLFKNSPKLNSPVIFPPSAFSFLMEFTIFTINKIIKKASIILGQKAAPSSVSVGAGDSAPTRKKRYTENIVNTTEKIMSKTANLPFPMSFSRGAENIFHSPCHQLLSLICIKVLIVSLTIAALLLTEQLCQIVVVCIPGRFIISGI